ncbi:MAG: hypothetical protein WCR72_06160 [Bacteroidota bacterium]
MWSLFGNQYKAMLHGITHRPDITSVGIVWSAGFIGPRERIHVVAGVEWKSLLDK